MSYEDFLKTVVSGAEAENALTFVLFITVFTVFVGLILAFLIELLTALGHVIVDKIHCKLLGIKRCDDQSFIGSIPLRDCPCCGSAPSVKMKIRKMDIGRVYCLGCGIGTDNAHLTKAFIVWNARPNNIDILKKTDYEQIFEIDKHKY